MEQQPATGSVGVGGGDPVRAQPRIGESRVGAQRAVSDGCCEAYFVVWALRPLVVKVPRNPRAPRDLGTRLSAPRMLLTSSSGTPKSFRWSCILLNSEKAKVLAGRLPVGIAYLVPSS